MILTTFLIVCTIRLGSGVRSYSKNEAGMELPKSFIVSTTLDVGPSKNKTDLRHIVQSEIDVTDRKLRDRRIENDKFYNFQKNKLQDLINLAPANSNSPKINFYSMDCAAGHKCTAIIPGPKTPVPLSKHRSKEEIKNYLRKHGLENGFNYSDDDRVNRHNVVARYFKDGTENRDRERSARKGRKIGNKFYDYEDYWPGSEYRPEKSNNLPGKSKAKIYKYGIKSLTKNGFNSNSWSGVPSSAYQYEDDSPASYELPFPIFSTSDNNGKIQYPTRQPYSETKNKGVWNRYSSSVISQYDKDAKDWVKISTSDIDLGSGFVNTHHKPPYHKGPSTKGPSIGLTVLGLPGVKDPFYYKKPNIPHYGQSYVPLQHQQQHHFSHYPDRPFPPSIHAPLKPSVSFPLNVLPPDLSVSSLVFTNEGINTNVSFTNATILDYSLHSNITVVPSLTYLPPAKINISVTRKPIRVSLPITHRSQPFQQTQISNTDNTSGGGGGGGGGSVFTNAYAVMAAVGAGLIPASIAAILPVLLGRRRKRSLEGIWGSPLQLNLHQRWEDSSSPITQGILRSFTNPTFQRTLGGPFYPTLLEARSPPDPIIQMLLRHYSHNKQILR